MYARREAVADEVAKESGHDDPSHHHEHHEGEHHHSEHHRLEGERHHHGHEHSEHEQHHHHHDDRHMSQGKPSSEGGMDKSCSGSKSGGLGREPGEHLIEGRSPRVISDESEESGIPPLAS